MQVNETKWLIVREIPNLRRFARALLRQDDAADDLVQDCLERALRKHHLWLRRGSMRAWLLRMLYNLYLNGAARRNRRKSDASLDDFEDRASSPASQEAHHHLRDTIAALEALPSLQREAILLMALQDLSYDEAAWVLGVPVGTVRSRLSRGREALREIVGGTRRSASPLRRIK